MAQVGRNTSQSDQGVISLKIATNSITDVNPKDNQVEIAVSPGADLWCGVGETATVWRELEGYPNGVIIEVKITVP